MFKFLLIIFVICYVLYKVGTFFFKIGAASQQMNRNRQQNSTTKKEPSSGKIKGGDYVDYEEVK